jgi:enoyl-CoA hydratase
MVVTMNRPKRYNALTSVMAARMLDAFIEASSDPDIRCIVLTGADGNFCSGADLRQMTGDDEDPDDGIDLAARREQDPDLDRRGTLGTYRPTKPIVAAVEGVAIAGGMQLLLGTDVRVAAESSRFGVTEARWSLYPIGGLAARLPRELPYTVAADMVLTGRLFDAAEALRLGLVGYVVPDGEAFTKAMEIAEAIAANGPLAIEAIVRTLHETEGMTDEEAQEHEREYGLAVFRSADAKEGPLAFVERRQPVYIRS